MSRICGLYEDISIMPIVFVLFVYIFALSKDNMLNNKNNYIMKKFIFVLKNRECGTVYVASSLFDVNEFQFTMVHLDSIGVDVLDILPVDIDLSKYEH